MNNFQRTRKGKKDSRSSSYRRRKKKKQRGEKSRPNKEKREIYGSMCMLANDWLSAFLFIC